jgi:hypothetical protein
MQGSVTRRCREFDSPRVVGGRKVKEGSVGEEGGLYSKLRFAMERAKLLMEGGGDGRLLLIGFGLNLALSLGLRGSRQHFG